jgi:hypothetical protein
MIKKQNLLVALYMIVETLRPALTICCGPRPAILSENGCVRIDLLPILKLKNKTFLQNSSLKINR